MLPLILIGLGALLINALSEEDDSKTKKEKRIFISFAVEDRKYRDFLVQQAKLDKSPFSFIDMSVKEPWRNHEWQRMCRIKIKKSDRMIVLLSKNTWHAGGVHWEIKCAKEEGIPIIGMHIKKNDKGAIPPGLKGKKIIEWKWDNISSFTNK